MKNKSYFAVLITLVIFCQYANAANHVIVFGGTQGNHYNPSTLNVNVGDSVTWQGAFSTHPLTSTSVASGASTFSNSSGSAFSYVVTVAGTYNYKCTIHGASGMTGSFTATAIASPVSFQKGYGTADSTSDASGASVQQTSDGGYITAGYISNFGAGDDDYYLVKTDANGVIAWTKTYGGSGGDDANSVIQTSDGGYAVAGVSTSFGGENILLVKTNASGVISWTKTYGTGDSLSDASAASIKQTADGGYIITGYIGNFGAGSDDIYLLKTDASGNIAWTKTYGGTGNDDANSVAVTADGGYVIIGNTTSFADSSGDVYLIKTDASGTVVWSKDYGDDTGGSVDNGNAVQQTTDKGYIIAGVTITALSGEFATLIKTDSAGVIQWTKAFGTGDASSDASASSVQQTSDGGYALAGYTGNFGAGDDDYLLVKTNASGDTLWTRAYGSSAADDANFIRQATDGGYIIGGVTVGFPSSGGGEHLYLVKTDATGDASCHQYHTTTVYSTAISIIENSANTQVSAGGVATTVTPTASSGGVAADLCSTVGIQELGKNLSEVNVFPNPFSNDFNISWNHAGKDNEATVQVVNMLGKVVLQFNAEQANGSMQTPVSISAQAPGIYFIRIADRNGNASQSAKVVKQ